MDIPVEIGLSPTLGIRGLLAARDITRGEVIERCPVVLFPVIQEALIEQTALSVYYFLWTSEFHAVAFGYGSLYNHSYHANVDFVRDYERKFITFRAVHDIPAGSELTINYNGHPDDGTPIDPSFLR